VSSTRGKEGIIGLEEVISEVEAEVDSETTRYADGSEIWWRWSARTKTITENGFVPRIVVNQNLGYKPNYTLRGFGDHKSGLKRLKKHEFENLLGYFKDHKRDISPPVSKPHYVGVSVRGTGESDKHRNLKEYVASNPSMVLGESGLDTLNVEYAFPTNDRADIILKDQFDRIVGVEIEVEVGPRDLAGVLQAVKYRFMMAVMTRSKFNESRSFLVAYSIASEIQELCRAYEVECFEIGSEDVRTWADTRA
jgi:hypothetical protein